MDSHQDQDNSTSRKQQSDIILECTKILSSGKVCSCNGYQYSKSQSQSSGNRRIPICRCRHSMAEHRKKSNTLDENFKEMESKLEDQADLKNEFTNDVKKVKLTKSSPSTPKFDLQDYRWKYCQQLEEVKGSRVRKAAEFELLDKVIEFEVIANDNQPKSMILLTGLKNVFQKQLPKMPKEYIARLVYDRNHTSMAIVVKSTLRVVGGITYRLFDHRGFAEIVFCAIASSEQVKGYGSLLMNHMKDHIIQDTNARHFLTYADNYAIGYFKKQGFSKEISLPGHIWMGYIKDYEGGTMMQCSLVEGVKYVEVADMLTLQKRIVNDKIQAMSSSHIVYPGLRCFKEGGEPIPPHQVPGLILSGYDPSKEKPRPPPRSRLQIQMLKLVAELRLQKGSWPFLEPVNTDEVPDYLTLIKKPMDLMTLEKNVENGKYSTKEPFLADAYLIFENARTYNAPSTPYFKEADRIEAYLNRVAAEWFT